MAFTARSIANLKDQVNIVDVVSRALPLKRSGSSYKGVCPFHNEKTPSFNVSEQKQMFYCFGCLASGDVIEFVKRYYNLEFNDAVSRLANEYSIEMEETKGSNENLDKYYKINKDAAEFFYKSFTEKANKGYSYMKNRSITPQYLKKYGIGYADQEWNSLYDYLKSKGHEEKDMMELGLISESKGKYYDKFRNRVIFPIINTRGKVIGFGGRAIAKEDNPKYLNSQESKVFQKKNNLYGLNLSRGAVSKEGYIIIVEGYMDVVSLYQSGIENVAASLGTALTEQQARLIKRYAKKVVLCYDSDNAGRNAALRGMEILRAEGLDVRVMHVTDGKDPDDYIKQNGKNAFLQLVDNALYYGEYKIADAIKDLNLKDHHDRINAIKRIAAILRTMTPGEREEYASKMSKELNISKSVLLDEASFGPEKENNKQEEKNPSNEIVDEAINQIESELLRLIWRNEEYILKVDENPELVEHDSVRRIIQAMKDNIEADGSCDNAKVLDQLDESDRMLVYNILENIAISHDDEKIFNGLVKKNRLISLQREVERINNILRYAGESEADNDEMEALMRRSMELQSLIVKVKSEEN